MSLFVFVILLFGFVGGCWYPYDSSCPACNKLRAKEV